MSAAPVPPDGEPRLDAVIARVRDTAHHAARHGAHLTLAEIEFYVREGFAAGRAAATPDPPCAHGLTGGRGATERCFECGASVPAASPDERLREALRDANEYLAQIADYSPSEVADAIDSVRAQIKDALAVTDSRGKPDGASVPDQSCATCGGSGDRNGNRRAADPFGTCPGCGGTGNVAAADQDNPDGER